MQEPGDTVEVPEELPQSSPPPPPPPSLERGADAAAAGMAPVPGPARPRVLAASEPAGEVIARIVADLQGHDRPAVTEGPTATVTEGLTAVVSEGDRDDVADGVAEAGEADEVELDEIEGGVAEVADVDEAELAGALQHEADLEVEAGREGRTGLVGLIEPEEAAELEQPGEPGEEVQLAAQAEAEPEPEEEVIVAVLDHAGEDADVLAVEPDLTEEPTGELTEDLGDEWELAEEWELTEQPEPTEAPAGVGALGEAARPEPALAADGHDTPDVHDTPDDYETLVRSAEAVLDAVDRALRRLDDGSYGACEDCGEPIGDDLLATVPTTATCERHLRPTDAA